MSDHAEYTLHLHGALKSVGMNGMRNAELKQKTITGKSASKVPVQYPFNPNSACPGALETDREFRNPHSRGFTLLEVLIATAIMAGIVTVIYTSFFTASRNVEQAENMRDTSDLVRTLISKISNDVANAYVNPAMDPLTVFYGKKVQPDMGSDTTRYDELYLTTLANSRRPGTKETDLWEVGYYFKQKPDGKGYVMMRREKRELTKDVPALEGGIEYELTDKVERFQFQYYNGFSWVDEWPRSNFMLPKVVQISLLLDDGSAYTMKVDVDRGR